MELVFFAGCPHVAAARERIADALSQAGLRADWREWDTTHADTPAAFHRFGSPTVLVDGHDVSGGSEGVGMRCVVGGGPSVLAIERAIASARLAARGSASL